MHEEESDATHNKRVRAFFESLPIDQQKHWLEQGFDPDDAATFILGRYIEQDADDSDEDQDGAGKKFDPPGMYNIDEMAHKEWNENRNRKDEDQQRDTFTRQEMHELVRRLVLTFDLSTNPEVALHGACIKIALGIGDPPTQTVIAQQHRVTRAAICKRVKKIRKMMALPDRMHNNSNNACDNYIANIDNKTASQYNKTKARKQTL